MATILIAEDERDIRELIGMTLGFGGHTVVKAANGAEAVELAPQVMPDLIMMDVRMPRMTGFEACVQLKKMESVKHIPVVFLSAKGQESDYETGIDAGAYDFILKPFSPAELIARINAILAKTVAERSAASAAPAPTTPTAESPHPAPVPDAPVIPAPALSAPEATTPSAAPAAPVDNVPALPDSSAADPTASTVAAPATATPDAATPPASPSSPDTPSTL